MPLAINEKYQPPRYGYEGMRVMAPYVYEGRLCGLWCEVIVAAGEHVRVRNDNFNVDKWFHIDSLRIETPRGPRALKRLRDAAEEEAT